MIALAALDAALDVWDDIDMAEVRRASLALSERFIAGVEARCPMLELASPRNGAERGSQVSFRHPHGFAIMQALIARGVIGDFRAPDILRVGIAPLYIGEAEIDRAVDILEEIMATEAWRDSRYRQRGAVT
jgi:kynureninase